MEPKTKKYLIWGGVGVGALIIFIKIHNASSKTTTAKKKTPTRPKTLPPGLPSVPSTAGQYPPVGYPQTYNPYPPVPYTPAYIPPPITGYPGAQYIPPAPIGYPGEYPGYPPTGYPYGGYPGTVQTPVTGVGSPPNIIGLPVAQAEAILQSLGIHSQIISLNGVQRSVSNIAYANGLSAYLTVQAGRVTNVAYNGASTTFPAVY